MTHAFHRSMLAAGLLAATLPALAGCGATHEGEGSMRMAPAAHQAVVFRQTRTHAVAFAPGRTDLDSTERSRLGEAVAKAGTSDLLHVRLPLADGPSASPEAGARRQAIIAALDTLGILPRRIEMDKQTSADTAVIVVSLDRYVAVPPAACPNWSDSLGSADSRQIASNWGCATSTNLGLMAADPHDLVVGRETSPASGAHAANAAERYRTDKVYPPTNSGTGSMESKSQ